MKQLKKTLIIILIILFIDTIAIIFYFPGQQAFIALQLSTGIGISKLQAKIDKLEEKAIYHRTFTTEDKQFLQDFYSCLARGAKITYILRQSGKLMQHYLDGEGTPLRLEESIFKKNKKVQKQMHLLRSKILKDMNSDKTLVETYYSPVFYMPDRSNFDSVFGLYYGKIIVKTNVVNGRKLRLKWRAEVPWKWPSYEYLKKKYGNYHAESFPLPNLLSVLLNKKYLLFVDNGLGEYLEKLELAKSFLAYSEWEEELVINKNN